MLQGELLEAGLHTEPISPTVTGITVAIHHYLMRPVGNYKKKYPVRLVSDGQFLLDWVVDLGSDPRTKQPTVAGDMLNKSVSGDLLPKWLAGDNIHALPAFTFAVAPGHPSITRNLSAVIFLQGLSAHHASKVRIFKPTARQIFFYILCIPKRNMHVYFILPLQYVLFILSQECIALFLSQSITETSHWKSPNIHQSEITS